MKTSLTGDRWLRAAMGFLGCLGLSLFVSVFNEKRDLTLAELDLAFRVHPNLSVAAVRALGCLGVLAVTILFWARSGSGRAMPDRFRSGLALFLPLGLVWIALFIPREWGREGFVAGLVAWTAYRLVAPTFIAPSDRHAKKLAWLAVGVFAIVFASLNVVRVMIYQLEYDHVFFMDVAKHTAEGRPLESTFLGRNLLSHHFIPFGYPLFLLWGLIPTPYTFPVVQALAVAGSALFLWSWASRILPDRATALFVVLAYVLNTRVWQATSFVFHPEAFQPAFFFAALLAVERRARASAALATLLLLACKEDSLLLALTLSAYAGVRHRSVGLATTIAGLAVFASFLFFGVLQPGLGDPSAGYDFVHRYEKWGRSAGEIAGTILTSPLDVLAHVFSGESLASTAKLLCPLLLIPFRARGWILPLVAVAGIHLLASYEVQRRLAVQYFFPVASVLWLSWVLGLCRLRERARALALAGCVGTIAWNVTERWSVYPPRLRAEQVRAIEETLNRIPDGAAVVADLRFLPHLLPRTNAKLRWTVDHLAKSDYVALDYSDTETWDAERQALNRQLMASGQFDLVVDTAQTRLFVRRELPRRNEAGAAGDPTQR